MADGPLSRLIAALTSPRAPEPLPEPDAQLALGALLVRVARSDNEYAVQEIARIDQILSNRFGLNAVDAAKLRATSEKVNAATPDTDTLATLIRDGVDYSDRLAMVQELSAVMLADGIRDAREEALIEEVCTLLGITAPDRETTRIIP